MMRVLTSGLAIAASFGQAMAQTPSDMGAYGAASTVRTCDDRRGAHDQLNVIEACDSLIDLFSTAATGSRINSAEDVVQLARAYVMRARAWNRFGDLDKASADFDRALELRPHDPLFLGARCRFLVTSNRSLDQATVDCAQWRSLRPQDIAALEMEGFLRLRVGEFETAVQDFDAALTRLGEDTATALYGRGLARLGLGQMEQGEADIAAARVMDETAVHDLERLGFVR